MNERIAQLKQDLFASPRRVSLERACLYTESWQASEGDPIILRRAKAAAHILRYVRISIRPRELVVGSRTVAPRSGIISPEMDPYWILDELDTLESRPQDPFRISSRDKKTYREYLYPYWKGRSLKDVIRSQLRPEIQAAADGGFFALNQTDKGQGHIIMDFPLTLQEGVEGIRSRLQTARKQKPHNLFYQAALVVFDAFHDHILRYAKLASAKRQSGACPPQRRRELELIENCCRTAAAGKPRTFLEACQLLWFVSIAAQYESNASSLSLGRFDQYMEPFFQYSLEQGETYQQLLEYLECFYLKTNDVVLIRSAESARYFAGFPTGYTITLGGIDAEGNDASNGLSSMALQAHADIRLPQPNLSVRTHRSMDQAFLTKTAETIRLGTGMPQLFNDEVIAAGFLDQHVPEADARDYAVVGCVELSVPGRTYGLHDIALVNLLKVMEDTLHRLKDRTNITYAEVIRELRHRIAHYTSLVTAGANTVDRGHRQMAPTPFLSTLIRDCLDRGLDVTEGGARYNFSGIQGVGYANTSDSLQALREAVFVQRRLSFSELIAALEQNFTGPGQESLRLELLNRCGKYGNDVEEVDAIAASLAAVFADELEKYNNARGGPFTAGAYTVSAHIPLGHSVGATPDGRTAREQLADGGLSPMAGRDRRGPTAVLKSVSRLNHRRFINGSLLNVKFSPDALAGDEGLAQFCAFIRAYVELQIQHIQFNILNREDLKKAQEHPELYRDVLVRVAGYSAFFAELDRALQDDIMARTEHGL